MEGKQTVSRNALKHGLTCRKTFVLQNEADEHWQSLLDTCIEEFKPVGKLQLDLVVEIAFARWRMWRLWTVETAMLDTEMDRQAPALAAEFKHIDEGVRLASAFSTLAAPASSLSLVPRYENRLRRAYERAVANLERLQARAAGRGTEDLAA